MKLRREQTYRLFKCFDQDGNGTVEYYEFCSMVFPNEDSAPSLQVTLWPCHEGQRWRVGRSLAFARAHIHLSLSI